MAEKSKYELFLIDGQTQTHLDRVCLNLADLPDVIILCEDMDASLQISTIPTGATLELVKMSGQSSNYGSGTPTSRFENCALARALIRPSLEDRDPKILPKETGYEYVAVFSCSVILL